MLYPAAHLPTVRRLERAHRAAVAREEQADDLASSWRLAAASDRAARALAAARDGLTIAAPRTRRNLARGAFVALAAIGRVIGRALARVESLRRATVAAAAKRAARKVATLARRALRRVVLAVVALVASSPAIAAAHPGHSEHDAPVGPGGVVIVGLGLGLATLAWQTWGERRRALVASASADVPTDAGGSPEPKPEPDQVDPLRSYFTVRIPYAAPGKATVWHPTEPTGPFATLTRGCFPSIEAARAWADDKLGGPWRHPYSVARVDFNPETDEDTVTTVYTFDPDVEPDLLTAR